MMLPLAMRMAGPREALWHAIIRKNHGCTHFIVGRDHAGPGRDADGDPFYPAYAAQELLQRHAQEIGIDVVPFQELCWVPSLRQHLPQDEVPEGVATETVSGTDMRRRLARGEELPAWFTFPEVERILRQRHERRTGVAVFLTGLPGSGKSSIAGILAARLSERGIPVTLLDGDPVRRHLSSELGFSKEDRDLNIRRIGFVAAEIVRHPARAADSYDVFRGDLNQLHTSGTAAFASMDSVACGVSPAGMPTVGERFVVSLPIMQTSAEYYLVAPEVVGAKRYGRWKRANAGLVGRNDSVMPPCSTAALRAEAKFND